MLLEQSRGIKENGEGLLEEMMPQVSPTKGDGFNQGVKFFLHSSHPQQKEEEMPKAERH